MGRRKTKRANIANLFNLTVVRNVTAIPSLKVAVSTSCFGAGPPQHRISFFGYRCLLASDCGPDYVFLSTTQDVDDVLSL